MQVGEQRQVGSQEGELLCLGLLHLHDHLLAPGVGGGRHDVGTGGAVVVVAEARAFARAGLDEHVDAQPLELAHTVGRHRHPVLGGLDLSGHADCRDRGC